MSTGFDDFDTMLSEVLGDVFGETAVLMPRVVHPDGTRSVDPDRPYSMIRGVFSDGPDAKTSGGQFFAAPLVQEMIADFWVAASEVGRLSFEPRQGDQIEMSCRPGPPSYMISGLNRTHQGDVHLILIEQDVD